MAGWEGFSGINRGYVLEQYERFRKDPASVDPETRALFEQWTPPAETDAVPDASSSDVPARTAVAACCQHRVYFPCVPLPNYELYECRLCRTYGRRRSWALWMRTPAPYLVKRVGGALRGRGGHH